MLNKKDSSIIEKIKEFIGKLLDNLRAIYTNLEPDSNAGRAVREMTDIAKQLHSMFADMALDAAQNKLAARWEMLESDGGVKYSLRKGADVDVEKALNDNNYTEDVYLTENSPSIIASQNGVRNLPMLMKASHIRENIFTEQEAKQRGLKVNKYINYHGLGKELFLKIIDGLDDVNYAYRGTKNAEDTSRRENYFLLISQYKDANGDTINVPVYINEIGQYNRVMIETNKIATVFGKENFFEYLNREVKKGNLVRIKSKSTQASDLRSPINDRYSKNASTDSISESDGNVNTSVKKSRRKATSPAQMTEAELYEIMGRSEELEKRNKELEADIKRLNKVNIALRSGGKSFTKTSVMKAAKMLKENYITALGVDDMQARFASLVIYHCFVMDKKTTSRSLSIFLWR